MSVPVLIALLVAISIYWFVTQILPERRKMSLLRPALGDGLLENVNEHRHQRGLPLLELDDELVLVAENKAVHQVMTGRADEGWEYPSEYSDLFGRSLLMEALFTGPLTSMVDRMAAHRDILDEEWISCGIGVASSPAGQVVVALILCREAWEPAAEVAHFGALSETSRA
jgi:hypothetical protein